MVEAYLKERRKEDFWKGREKNVRYRKGKERLPAMI
jgi:hypothetical protein